MMFVSLFLSPILSSPSFSMPHQESIPLSLLLKILLLCHLIAYCCLSWISVSAASDSLLSVMVTLTIHWV